MGAFSFIGYLYPVRGENRELQEARCKVIAMTLGGTLEGVVEEECPDSRRSLIKFIEGAQRSFRGATLLAPNEASVIGCAEACYWLHLRFLEVAAVDAVYGFHGATDFEDALWRHANSMHRRIRSKAAERVNIYNQQKRDEAIQKEAALLEDAFALLTLERQTSQSSVAYLLSKRKEYRHIDEGTLQRQISRALKRSGRTAEFRKLGQRNREKDGVPPAPKSRS